MKFYNRFILIALLAFLYVTTGAIGFEILSGYKIVNLGLFVPEGIALAFALYFGKQVIPGIFFGQLILAYFFGDISFIPAVIIGIINSAEALLAIYFIARLRVDIGLKTFRDIISLLGLIVFVLQPFSAILSNIVLYMSGDLAEDGHFLYFILSWWFGNVMGQIVVAPFLLMLFVEYKQIDYKNLLIFGFLYGLYIYILEFVVLVDNAFILMSLSLAVLIFTVVNKNLLYGAFLSNISALMAGYSIYKGVGAFTYGSLATNTIEYNIYILSHIVIVWIIGILFEERKQYEASLKLKIEEEVERNKRQQLLMLQQNRLAQMGELLSMIAHQWRQPLNNLSLINQLVLMKYQKGQLDDKAMESFKENSKKQIDFMSNTINDFRNFFQNEEKECLFSYSAVINHVIDIIKPSLEKHNINVVINTIEEDEVYTCKNSLIQVLLSLFNNAKDILIERNIENKQITISLYKEGDAIVLDVQDNAGGIDETIIDHIFDPYFSTKKEKNGKGLGLYMSKMVIEEQIGGKLEVQNNDNGAVFKIIITKGQEK